MRYLKLRTNTKPRACGLASVTPLIVDAPRKFAKQKKETPLQRKRCQLITGAHDCGKSRWLNRLHEGWKPIWGAKVKSSPVYLGALQPVSTWTDQLHVENWFDRQPSVDATRPNRKWQSLNQQQRADQLEHYLAATGALLFIDDAHRLTGRKLQIARLCLISSKIWLVASAAENRLPPNVRPIIERRDPQRIKLSTDASYDATSTLMWGMVFVALVIGWWEVSLVLGGLKMLGSGRRAARPD
jgi:hypothetical protein